jgi:hypothetical protein
MVINIPRFHITRPSKIYPNCDGLKTNHLATLVNGPRSQLDLSKLLAAFQVVRPVVPPQMASVLSARLTRWAPSWESILLTCFGRNLRKKPHSQWLELKFVNITFYGLLVDLNEP